MESFIIVSKIAQLSHYAALLKPVPQYYPGALAIATILVRYNQLKSTFNTNLNASNE